MRRLEAVRLAAANAYVEATRERTGPERYEGQHEHLTKLNLEGLIGNYMGATAKDALDLFLGDAVAELQSIRLGHYDPREYAEPGQEMTTKLEDLRAACEAMIAEVDAMAEHRCDFNSDDYCVTCGLDGRA